MTNKPDEADKVGELSEWDTVSDIGDERGLWIRTFNTPSNVFQAGLIYNAQRKKWSFTPGNEHVEQMRIRLMSEKMIWYPTLRDALAVMYFLHPEYPRFPPEELDKPCPNQTTKEA